MTKLQHTFPKPTFMDEELAKRPLDKTEQAVTDRHHQVAEIIDRHLKELHQEILELDPKSMNMDGAGDQAEIARQVLTALVDQLRGFAVGSRNDIRQDRARQAKLPMELLKDEMKRAFRELSEASPDHAAKAVDMVAAVSQRVDPEVERALMVYALKVLLDELLN
jgi:hypothetical protein